MARSGTSKTCVLYVDERQANYEVGVEIRTQKLGECTRPEFLLRRGMRVYNRSHGLDRRALR